MSDRTPGRAAYEGYLAYSGGRSLVSGGPLPSWGEQTDELRAAWEQAAGAALDEYAAVRSDEPGDFGSGVRF